MHLVDALRRSELIDDASTLLWQLRPSAHYPTLEFRIADMCPSADDAVLYAALARSLVRTLGTRVQDGVAPPEVPDALLRAAGWRAARYGMSDALWSPTRHELVPAWDAVDDLHAELQTDLDDHGEADEVQRLLAALRGRGTSADQQRATYASTQSLYEVTRAAVDLTAGRRG